MKRYLIVFLLAALLMPSCKKDKDTEVLPSLEGSLYFVMKPYYRAGDEVTLKPIGITHPEGKGIGYWWLVSAVESERDTVKLENEDKVPLKTFTVPDDKTGYCSVSCSAFASGYYSTSASQDFYIVDPKINQTIYFTGILQFDDKFTVASEREGEGNYYTLEKDGLTWMRNNLANTSCGVPYADCEVMSYPLGRFYTWEEAQTACPEGWRLPTDAEWASWGTVAGDLMVNAYMDEVPLWEYWPQVKITNSTSMCVLPSGYAVVSEHNQFQGFCEYAAFWTADTDPDDAAKALYRYINVNDPKVFTGSADKTSYGASVRCVK